MTTNGTPVWWDRRVTTTASGPNGLRRIVWDHGAELGAARDALLLLDGAAQRASRVRSLTDEAETAELRELALLRFVRLHAEAIKAQERRDKHGAGTPRKTTLAERETLRARREAANLSQRDLAEAAGVSRGLLSDLEAGRREGTALSWGRLDDALTAAEGAAGGAA